MPGEDFVPQEGTWYYHSDGKKIRVLYVFPQGHPDYKPPYKASTDKWINYSVLEVFFDGFERTNAFPGVSFGEICPSTELPDRYRHILTPCPICQQSFEVMGDYICEDCRLDLTRTP